MTKHNTVKISVLNPGNIQVPAVLTIAGSDSSGGAGIEADLKTFTRHGVYGLTCITALTAQNTTGVFSIQNTSKDQLESILKLNCEDFIYGYASSSIPLKVIKTGMLTSEVIEILPSFLPVFQEYKIKLVVDPVMISTSGAKLFTEDGMKKCLDSVVQNAYLITPNFSEAITLYELASGTKFDIAKLEHVDDLTAFAVDLQEVLKCNNVLLKGGHVPIDERGHLTEKSDDKKSLVDILYQADSDTITVYKSDFIDSKNTHGTGCTLASSISANLAKEITLTESIALSIDYVHRAIQKESLGHGNGPLNHLVDVKSTFSYTAEFNLEKTHYCNFKTHPKVHDYWQEYTNHTFIKRLANNQLPFDQFLYYLKQDYYYLANYAAVHKVAAEKAPNEEQKLAQYVIIELINTECENHKKKLKDEYNFDYDENFDFKPGKACLDYCSYLLKVAEEGDFLDIKVAVAPCLHGYKEAGVRGVELRKRRKGGLGVLKEEKHNEVYDDWLNEYTSEWYEEAHKVGIQALEEIVNEANVSEGRYDELIKIFGDVTKLEIEFWRECLNV